MAETLARKRQVLPTRDKPRSDLQRWCGEIITDLIVGTEQRFGLAAQLLV